ncbi:MAG: two-component system sensor histidine kinase CreC [Steroidobacteraceae bacterium]
MPRHVSLSLRIFLVYLLFVGLSGYFVFSTVMNEIRPGVRQSAEETLVDTANLLAEILRDEVKNGTLQQSRFTELLEAYGRRRPQARIWGIDKTGVNHRIYVTDRNGVVLLDSTGRAVGQDYSHWNDVYLTLKGQYGARTTQDIPGDESSTVMYVAAPILDADQIIGVVTVAKPNRNVQPYIDRTQRRLGWIGGGLVLAGLVVGGFLSWWVSASIRNLTRYAQAVSAGQRAELPRSPGGELNQLAQALASMRTQLDGKTYVERYVQTLTHELKSPLAAIRGASELLRRDMSAEQHERFVANIESEALRMQQLIERLLNLAMVEHRQVLESPGQIEVRALFDELLAAQAGRIEAAGLTVINEVTAQVVVRGERFLLRQALGNLLENALEFTPPGGWIRCSAQAQEPGWLLLIANQGEAIPEFALPRLGERFYSLPRPATGRKSTGLGLSFVQEVAQLHGGSLQVLNIPGGVEARLSLRAG